MEKKKKVKKEESCDLNKQSAGATSSSSISDGSCSFGFKSPGVCSGAETTSPSYRMFIDSCRRLRIMKGSEAIGLGRIVLEALILTSGVVFALTGYTFWASKKGKDFSYLGPILFAGLMVLFLTGLIQVEKAAIDEVEKKKEAEEESEKSDIDQSDVSSILLSPFGNSLFIIKKMLMLKKRKITIASHRGIQRAGAK